MLTKQIWTIFACFALTGLLSACGGSSNKDSENAIPDTETETETDKDQVEAPTPESTFKIGLLPDTQGGTDSDNQAHVAMHPMDEVLAHQQKAGVDLVIAVGDLTDHGSTLEFNEWRSVAEPYRDSGMTFLPVMGNHETSYAYTVEWIENMRDFIPEDAVHMHGYEWVNYYVIRDNVLIIGLAYYNLPIAFDWITGVILEHRDDVDHIVVASHDGLIGAKYGQTREQIVDGTKDDNWVYDVQPRIRDFFAEHDVIYVQGHEHQYQRSVVSAKTILTTLPSGSTPTGGNYRMDVYTQIMSGNASYKGYEFRYGERDLVQAIVAQKNATMSGGSQNFDVNSSVLSFTGTRVDYESWFAPHTAQSNDADQDFIADWSLLDKFSRSTNRCEMLIYPTSIPEGTRSVMVLQPEYRSDICISDSGLTAKLIGGENATFNRTDTRTRDMSYTPGISRAESLMDLTRLAYQWLFQVHESWTPNLNSAARIIPNFETEELVIPETTFDLKEHVTLSWLPAANTASEILLISGTQNQTGVYQDDYGVPLDIEAATGLPLSSATGTEKPAVVLPPTASKEWDLATAVSDTYAVSLQLSDDHSDSEHTLAWKIDGHWTEVVSHDCRVEGAFDEAFLNEAPTRLESCRTEPVAGFDTDRQLWWVLLNQDIELALITQ
ncbi:metallophosphoesterase [Gilvimarinus agarilyticus]|uniref:metallophosphoesterase family protein n=1 Tax=Gilvimarinus sp. 2_MG-2023 TaxID=3062666 RepID=UPI001C09766B|nr:metallophosphoesterase [Gilvimarinus sp. 2_MG-2023]MBU2886203.1 metallophosphoesterase [Gilvimarinus agarilyticus]MDO6570891.1 metallophosphoesterase [Gilvimarinus sp. 2_MG-2023]